MNSIIEKSKNDFENDEKIYRFSGWLAGCSIILFSFSSAWVAIFLDEYWRDERGDAAQILAYCVFAVLVALEAYFIMQMGWDFLAKRMDFSFAFSVALLGLVWLSFFGCGIIAFLFFNIHVLPFWFEDFFSMRCLPFAVGVYTMVQFLRQIFS